MYFLCKYSEQVRHDSEGSKVKLEDQSPAETQVTVDTINTEKEGEVLLVYWYPLYEI